LSGFNGIDYFMNFIPSVGLQSFDMRINLSNFTVVGLETDGANLFAVGGSGTTRTVGQVGTGFPTMPASIVTVPGFPGSNTNPTFPVDAYFTHLDGPGAPAGINTFYVADDGQNFSKGTITKWSFDGTNWNLTSTISADGMTVVSFYWLAGQTNGNMVNLYVTYGQGGNGDMGRGDLYQVTDSAGYGQPFSSTIVTTIATVSDTSLENFRGVAFTPQPSFTGRGIIGFHSSAVGAFTIERTGNVAGSDSVNPIAVEDQNPTRQTTLSTDAIMANDVALKTNVSGFAEAYDQMALDSVNAGTQSGLNATISATALVWFGSNA
jgi:hypothetical protein